MATEEIEISQLELADEILADMVTPVETATETKAVTLSQLRKWLGSSLPTGFIIASIGKMNDSRFTLLDGKTLSRTGTYEDFCNKVIEQVNAGNWFSCTQSEYDEDLSNYGQCGRFVIETDYIRIPTLGKSLCSGVVNGTIPVVGNGITLGLTDGNNNFGLVPLETGSTTRLGSTTGVYGQPVNTNNYGSAPANNKSVGLTTDPTKSGIEGKINSVEVYYYMVVSTEGQTDPVEIDINNVYEDLNLKANKDLSDVSQAGKTTVAGWGMPSDNYINLTLGVNLSTYTAPANGYFTLSKATGNGNQFVCLRNVNNGMRIYSGMFANNAVRVFMPVKKGQVVEAEYNASGVLEFFRFIYAEGEI